MSKLLVIRRKCLTLRSRRRRRLEGRTIPDPAKPPLAAVRAGDDALVVKPANLAGRQTQHFG
jgi:hypothetical protein